MHSDERYRTICFFGFSFSMRFLFSANSPSYLRGNSFNRIRLSAKSLMKKLTSQSYVPSEHPRFFFVKSNVSFLIDS